MKHLLFIVLIAAGCHTAFSQNNSEDYLQEGNNELNKGNYQQALSDFNHAIKGCVNDTDPKLGKGYLGRGSAYLKLIQYKLALADFISAIPFYKSDKQRSTVIYLSIGVAQYNLSNYRDAINALNTAISITPVSADAFGDRGEVYKTGGQYQLALNDFTTAISYSNGDWESLSDLYNAKADCEENLNEYNKAIRDDSMALIYNRENGDAYWSEGRCYKALNKFNDAVKEINTAIGFYNKDTLSLAKLYDDLGICLYRSDNRDSAFEAFGRSISLNSKDGKTYYDRGNCYESFNKFSNAIKDFDVAVNYFKTDTGTLVAIFDKLGDCQMLSGKIGKSITSFKRSISLNPKYADAYWGRASAYADTGDYKQAVNDYLTAIPLYKDDKENLSRLYKDKGVYERLLRQYDNAANDELKAINLNPTFSDAYLELGRIYLLQNKKTESTTYFKKAIQFDSTEMVSATCLFFMGDSVASVNKIQKQIANHLNSPPDLYYDYYEMACLMALMNKPNDVIVYLKKALDGGIPKHYAIYSPYFNAIRNTAGFKTLSNQQMAKL